MSQADIDRAVARATGETVATVRQLGFSLLPPHIPVFVNRRLRQAKRRHDKPKPRVTHAR